MENRAKTPISKPLIEPTWEAIYLLLFRTKPPTFCVGQISMTVAIVVESSQSSPQRLNDAVDLIFSPVVVEHPDSTIARPI
jgi:hypothetical protein